MIIEVNAPQLLPARRNTDTEGVGTVSRRFFDTTIATAGVRLEDKHGNVFIIRDDIVIHRWPRWVRFMHAITGGLWRFGTRAKIPVIRDDRAPWWEVVETPLMSDESMDRAP